MTREEAENLIDLLLDAIFLGKEVTLPDGSVVGRIVGPPEEPQEPLEPVELNRFHGSEVRFWEENYTASLVAEDPRMAAALADEAVRCRRARLKEEG